MVIKGELHWKQIGTTGYKLTFGMVHVSVAEGKG